MGKEGPAVAALLWTRQRDGQGSFPGAEHESGPAALEGEGLGSRAGCAQPPAVLSPRP